MNHVYLDLVNYSCLYHSLHLVFERANEFAYRVRRIYSDSLHDEQARSYSLSAGVLAGDVHSLIVI